MKNFLEKFIDLVFENSCLICNESSGQSLVCSVCENDFALRKENNVKHFERLSVYSWGVYEGKLRQGILELKAGKKKLANYFSNKLLDFWNIMPNEIKNKNYNVIPVPSHKKRTKERGYCQSTLIAYKFSDYLGLKFSNKFIIRKKETLYMNSLSNINERQLNIKNAFELNPLHNIINEEKNMLIIDDILTSGSTMCELARTIHKKYPELNLIGLTVASGDTYN